MYICIYFLSQELGGDHSHTFMYQVCYFGMAMVSPLACLVAVDKYRPCGCYC